MTVQCHARLGHVLSYARGNGASPVGEWGDCARCGLRITREWSPDATSSATNCAPWLTTAELCALVNWRLDFPECAEAAAFLAYQADEMAHEARYPHVDFPDGDSFARTVDEDELHAADAAHQVLIRTHPDAF